MYKPLSVLRIRFLHLPLAILGLYVSQLNAQNYRVTIGTRYDNGVKTPGSNHTIQEIQYSIPLSVSAQQVDDILRERPNQISVSLPDILPFRGSIRLNEFDVFTPEARAYTAGALGSQESSFREEWASFRGQLPNDDRSIVVMNFSRSGLDAMIIMGGETYLIRVAGQPTQETWPHLFYAASAVKSAGPFRCGVSDIGEPNEVQSIIQQLESQRAGRKQEPTKANPIPTIKHNPPDVVNPFGPAISSDTIEVRVALEGDYELFLAMGSEQAALNLMMSTATYASAVYLSQVSVKLTVPFIRVWTTSSTPYRHDDPFVSISDFITYWSQNMGNVDRTVAHLFTNSSRWSNPTGYSGVAQLNSLCSNLIGYGLTVVRQPSGTDQLMTFTHELGHNFGAHHTHSCFWPNGPLDYCAPIEEGSCYTGPIVQSDGTIMSYCTTRKFEFGPVVANLVRRNAEFAACAPTVNTTPIAQADSTLLDNLYTSTSGSAWNVRTNWQSGPVSQRYGITVRGGRVISINLSANNLSGQIPTNISSLGALRVLNLSGRNKYHVPFVAPPDPATDRFNANSLTGQIPTTIGQLTALEELDLSNNQLTGSFPAALLNLQQLRVLNLSENSITGTIPSTIGNLMNLETLDLWRTSMTGQIPSSIGNLRLLRVLVLSELFGSADNQFTRLNGTIPPELGNLSRLSILDLSNNALSGPIPTQMGNLTSLTVLNLGGNKLTGPIPSEVSHLGGLTSLSLNDNQLSGSLPSSIGSFSSLSAITVANNKLSGSIPSELGNLTILLGLHLENNAFSGQIPVSLGRLTNLLDFDVHANALSGTVPDSLVNLGTAAPSDFGGLVLFRIGDNQLTGPIPSWLSNRPTISQLDLGGNQFDKANGPIPAWVLNRPSLTLLHLHNMQFTGSFPVGVTQFTSMISLKLSGNKLTGAIPHQIGSMRSLGVLWLSDNQLTDSLPTELGNLLSLTDLRLSNNQFTGTIPSSLGNIGGQLQYLYLSGNRLTGAVPATFETFGSLRQLALSDNDLQSIPRLFVLGRALLDSAGFMSLQNNRLTFSSLVPMMFAVAQIPVVNFTYVPQKPFGTAQSFLVTPGSSVTMRVSADDQKNTYQWTKNGSPIAGATDTTLTVKSVSVVDTGQYVAVVKNSSIPLLTLQSQPFTVSLSFASKPDVVTLASPPDGATGAPTSVTVTWNVSVQATFYRFQLGRDSSFATLVFDTTVTATNLAPRNLSVGTKYYWRVSAGNPVGVSDYSRPWGFTTSATVSGIFDAGGDTPREFRLEQNYPNPFNPSTTIKFAVPKQSHVQLNVYSILGQLVTRLVDEDLNAGMYGVRWDAAGYTSGVYLYRIQAGTFSEAKKLFLLK